MITDALFSLVSVIVTFFDSLLPHFSPPTWFSATSGIGATMAGEIGGALGVVQPILPVDAVINVLYALLIILPVLGAYTVFQWIWSHIPEVAGFGTH